MSVGESRSRFLYSNCRSASSLLYCSSNTSSCAAKSASRLLFLKLCSVFFKKSFITKLQKKINAYKGIYYYTYCNKRCKPLWKLVIYKQMWLKILKKFEIWALKKIVFFFCHCKQFKLKLIWELKIMLTVKNFDIIVVYVTRF